MKRDRDPTMKKFTIKGVLDNFRTSVAQQARADQEIQETLRPEHFQVKRTFRHGFPFQPTAVAFDPIQRLLAIGAKCGSLRLLGQPGVDVHLRHDTDGSLGSSAVVQLQFLVNEGALISATADDTLHLWNFRQKVPQVVQSLKFQKERITCMHLPLQSKWLYVGTERGNIHVVNIESFVLSGYIINWNKVIEVSRKTHPGPVVHLSDNPLDTNKLLVGYESGQVVLWDLKNKTADIRYQTSEPLRAIAWHHEGKQFMCSHNDGSLTTWGIKLNQKPLHISQPHAKVGKDGKIEQCKAIPKVEWKSSKTGEAYVIFSGGNSYDQSGRTPSITVVHSKITTVLEMEHPVVDFITLCESPYTSEMQEPYAIIALLQTDLVVIDLQTVGFPCLENPYPMNIHESPVTCCSYLADCPADLIPAFYSVGIATAVKRTDFSDQDWPISGGTWTVTSCSYSEIILTGHADGTLKFWDASAGTLQVLYKLKTAKIFEKPARRSLESEDEPFAVQLISFCPESRKLCLAGASSHVILYCFKRFESNEEMTVLEVPIVYENPDEGECSPDCQFSGPGSAGSGSRLDMMESSDRKDILRVRAGNHKKPVGYQVQLVCITPWSNGEAPSNITSLTINSSYGLMAYGNEAGIVIIDIEQKVCLLNVGSPDLYGAQDPYCRAPRSPKRGTTDILPIDRDDRHPRSPSIDQMGSPESPLFPMPCPLPTTITNTTPVEVAHEALEDVVEQAVPIPQTAAGRRKSSTWKSSLNIKRRLSKVDIKIKFRSNSSSSSSTTAKRNSIFYAGVSPTQDPSYEEENEEDAEESDDVLDTKDSECEELYESDDTLDAGGCGKGAAKAVDRPCDLDLPDGPVPPPRNKKKKQRSRDQRLLSVPNIKYKPDLMLDLRGDKDDKEVPCNAQPSFAGHLMRRFNKLDNSFSRSRSSSISSLENITAEAIQCLVFADSYAKRTEPNHMTPTLWVGTSLGSVLTVLIGPTDPDSRSSQPVVVSLVGVTIFRLKGAILSMSFMDCNGSLIPNSYESWKDDNKDRRDSKLGTPTKCSSRMSPTLGDNQREPPGDRQYVVITSEKQARVVGLPSQTCVYRQQIADTDFVVKAVTTSMKDSICLACYVSNGHLQVYSLPSLRPLIDIDFLPLSELSFQTQSNKGIVDPMLSIWGQQLIVNEDTNQISKTFCFSNRGHGLYLCSPSELQKFTLCADFCTNMNVMLGEIFIPLDMPEPPKESFFRGLFGGGVRSLDREELFGENSGKASKHVAKHIPGALQEMNSRVASSSNEISRAHKLMLERGEKLGKLEDSSERMRNEAENFAGTAHDLMLKYKDKKWYQL
ncbi:PREDICTED: syntaxin-binding protein 5 isoform X2 [Nicrophorus vespilloides]|uniref:Syntaxin-binding protein 5 isoform X2 n=1 Tax=Nicrophorus vespilloides TaxID=110193 RepID=A0ABM1N6L7_NICVS|nr:PREDICTED: syntaxin-binding protein 5 isoform X2 [Nicrophorus vespilloides]